MLADKQSRKISLYSIAQLMLVSGLTALMMVPVVVSVYVLVFLEIFSPLPAQALGTGSLVKGPNTDAVYYLDGNQKHVFPDAKTYFSWYYDFSGIQTVSIATLDSYTTGKSMFYRPGTKLITHPNTARVYAVEPDGTLRHLPDEITAKNLFGVQWAKRVNDVHELTFGDYGIGTSLDAVLHPEGTVLIVDGQPSVYYFDGLNLRRFASGIAFTSNGLKWGDLVIVTSIGQYQLGSDIVGYEEHIARGKRRPGSVPAPAAPAPSLPGGGGGGGGNPGGGNVPPSSPPDITAPIISGTQSGSFTNESATISWTTNESSDSKVQFGLTTSYGSQEVSSTLVTAHVLALSSLSPSTLYHYRVMSCDTAGNCASSVDLTFSTTATSDVTAPTISAVSVASITDTTASVSWTTNEQSDTKVEYGATSAYGQQVADTLLTTGHASQLASLSPHTLYHYKVTSCDGASNCASGADLTFTTTDTPDTQAPVISQIGASAITQNSATISWATSENADSRVDYGLTTSYGSLSTSGSLVATRSLTLNNLTASTLYHYRVISCDGASNCASGADLTFTTTAPSDVTAPTISSISSGTITSSGATIAWTTNENSDSQVEYGPTTAYGSSTTVNSSLVTNHNVSISGLSANTLYHYRVKSRDAAANVATSGDQTLTTLGVSGLKTQYLTFDGSSGLAATYDYVTVPAGAFTGPFTVGMWFKPAAGQTFPGGSKPILIGNYNPFTGDSGFNIRAANQNEIRCDVATAAGIKSCGGINYTPTESWVFVALAFDGASANLYLYNNAGTQIGVSTMSFVATTYDASPANALYVGTSYAAGDSTPSRAFSGSIDDVRIYNRALLATEIQSSLGAELAGNETGLVGYYKFNEGSGQVAGNGVNGGLAGTLGSSASADNNDPSWNTASGDTTVPAVAITAPASGATVSAITTVSANASDNVGVVGVQFKLDGANLSTEDTSSPYSLNWDTTTVANGIHILTAVARDAAGNTATSAGINVTVNNAVVGCNNFISAIPVTLSTPNTSYCLSQDLTSVINDAAITIKASNVTVDGQGHTITIPSSQPNLRGVYLDGGIGISGVTVKNLVLRRGSGWATIELQKANNSELVGNQSGAVSLLGSSINHVANNTFHGGLTIAELSGTQSLNNHVANNVFEELNSTDTGPRFIHLAQGSGYNIFENNTVTLRQIVLVGEATTMQISLSNNNIVRNNTMTIQGIGKLHPLTVRSTAANNLIENNIMVARYDPSVGGSAADIAISTWEGIYLGEGNIGPSHDTIFRGNTLTADSFGIFILGNSYNNTITRNVIDVKRQGIFDTGTVGDNNQILNNTIYSAGSVMETNMTSGTGNKYILRNNIFSGGNDYAFRCWSYGYTNFISDYNLYYRSDGGAVTNCNLAGKDANSLMGVNPLLVNAAAKDFHLQATSPAVDNGMVIAGVTDGYISAAPDIGAYESSYTGSGTSYYVRTDGNNACNGTVNAAGSSGNCSWATIAKAFSAALQPGDTVYVNDGIYRMDQSILTKAGTASRPITFKANGSNVIISGAKAINESLFAPTAGYPHVYEISTANLPGGTYDPLRQYVTQIDGQTPWLGYRAQDVRVSLSANYLTPMNSLQENELMPKSVFFNATLNKLYLRTSDGNAPASHELELSISNPSRAIILRDSSYIIFDGFILRHAGIWMDGNIGNDHITIRNINAIASHLGTGASLKDRDNILENSWVHEGLFGVAITVNLSTGVFDGQGGCCSVWLTGTRPIIRNVLIEEMANATADTGGIVDGLIENSIFRDNPNHSTKLGTGVNGLTIRNSIYARNQDTLYMDGGVNGVKFYNSIMDGKVHFQTSGGLAPTNIEVRNNIMQGYAVTSGDPIGEITNADFTGDYNLFLTENGLNQTGNFEIGRSTPETLAQWQARTATAGRPQDVNSRVVNGSPLFVDWLNDNWRPVSGALSIDAGTASATGALPTADKDGYARPVDGNGDGTVRYDIGAYEFH